MSNDGPKAPKTYKAFVQKFPDLAQAHDAMGAAARDAGPLDEKTCALIKIGISLGAGLDSAVRSHVRRALFHGASEEEVEQAVLLGMTTCGFPRTVAAWQSVQVQIERGID